MAPCLTFDCSFCTLPLMLERFGNVTGQDQECKEQQQQQQQQQESQVAPLSFEDHQVIMAQLAVGNNVDNYIRNNLNNNMNQSQLKSKQSTIHTPIEKQTQTQRQSPTTATAIATRSTSNDKQTNVKSKTKRKITKEEAFKFLDDFRAEHYGKLPSIRAIMKLLKVGFPKAHEILKQYQETKGLSKPRDVRLMPSNTVVFPSGIISNVNTVNLNITPSNNQQLQQREREKQKKFVTKERFEWFKNYSLTRNGRLPSVNDTKNGLNVSFLVARDILREYKNELRKSIVESIVWFYIMCFQVTYTQKLNCCNWAFSFLFVILCCFCFVFCFLN